MTDIDRIIHEPVRLRILSILTGVDLADFNFFLSTLGLSRGNLSSHMDKLERAGYVEVLDVTEEGVFNDVRHRSPVEGGQSGRLTIIVDVTFGYIEVHRA